MGLGSSCARCLLNACEIDCECSPPRYLSAPLCWEEGRRQPKAGDGVERSPGHPLYDVLCNSLLPSHLIDKCALLLADSMEVALK